MITFHKVKISERFLVAYNLMPQHEYYFVGEKGVSGFLVYMAYGRTNGVYVSVETNNTIEEITFPPQESEKEAEPKPKPKHISNSLIGIIGATPKSMHIDF